MFTTKGDKTIPFASRWLKINNECMTNTTETPLLRLYLITHIITVIKLFILFSRVILAFLKFERKPSDCILYACAKKKNRVCSMTC